MKIDSKLIILIFGRIIQIVVALVAIKLATKYLDASEMGNYYIIVSIAGFFGLFLVGPIGQYINRKTHQWYEEKKIINVLYIYNYYIIFLALISIIIIRILNYYHYIDNIDILLLNIIFIFYIIAHTWNQTIIPMINMLEHRVAFVLFTIASQLLFLFFAFALIFFLKREGLYWFLGQAIGFFLTAIVALIYFIKKIQNRFSIISANKMVSKESFKRIIAFSFPLAISALFFWIQTQSYSLIINRIIGSEFLGYFGVGMAIALAISAAFESIVMQYIYPSMYKSMRNNKEFSQVISKMINLIIPIYTLVSIYVSIFAIFINSILVDKKYFHSYIFVIFGIWIVFFRISSNMISNIAYSKMKTKKLIYPNLFGAIITVIGIIFATNSMAYEIFIPLALLIGSISRFIMIYIMMNGLVAIRFKLYNLLVIFLYAIPLSLGILFYQYAHIVTYSIVIVFIFGIYFLYVLYKLIKKGSFSEK